MSRLFLFGILIGITGGLAGVRFYPWIEHERVPAETGVIANGGRTETFMVRLPADRIARLASGAGAHNFPAGLETPSQLLQRPVSVEHFKLRATGGAVIGIASRHWTMTSDGPALAWSLTIPGRGTIMLVGPGQNGNVVEDALRRIGYVAGETWSGDFEIVPVPERAATQTIASSDEFADFEMQFTETWSITGISADGELRGTIVLDTIGQGGS